MEHPFQIGNAQIHCHPTFLPSHANQDTDQFQRECFKVPSMPPYFSQSFTLQRPASLPKSLWGRSQASERMGNYSIFNLVTTLQSRGHTSLSLQTSVEVMAKTTFQIGILSHSDCTGVERWKRVGDGWTK